MVDPAAYIHPTAVVDEPVHIGAETKVWHFSHVMSGARIGKHCSLGQNAFVAGSVTMGDGVRVQNNVSLYDGVTVEDDVFLGPSCVFTNVSHPRSAVSRKDAYEKTHVERGVSVGANATIVCGVTLGAFSFVAAGAVVTHDVQPYALVAGVPARRIGWCCACGETLTIEQQRAVCDRCHADYVLEAEGLSPIGE